MRLSAAPSKNETPRGIAIPARRDSVIKIVFSAALTVRVTCDLVKVAAARSLHFSSGQRRHDPNESLSLT